VSIDVRLDARAFVASTHELERDLRRAAVEAVLDGAVVFTEEWRARVPTDRDAYRAGIHAEIEGPSPSGPSAIASSGVDDGHDVYLEFGTARMPAHPSLRPAWEVARGLLADLVMLRIARLLGR
jgi:HK97 gp10 family phage protein